MKHQDRKPFLVDINDILTGAKVCSVAFYLDPRHVNRSTRLFNELARLFGRMRNRKIAAGEYGVLTEDECRRIVQQFDRGQSVKVRFHEYYGQILGQS